MNKEHRTSNLHQSASNPVPGNKEDKDFDKEEEEKEQEFEEEEDFFGAGIILGAHQSG